MLIKCPECGLQASDKALSCPHCGYPFQQNHKAPKIRKSNRRRRLPNGFGQITELKGRALRKPFRAMVTIGKNENGRPICKLLKPDAYFATYNEAYEALVNYNKNPFDVNSQMTMNELFDRWSEEHFKELKSASAKRGIIANWKYCKLLHNMPISEVRAKHIRECMDTGYVETKQGVRKTMTPYAKIRMKQIVGQMFDYAIQYDLIDRNFARMLKTPAGLREEVEENKRHHIIFKKSEMDTLWKHEGERYVDMILIQCYSGWRPTELCILNMDEVHLDENYIMGGIKTPAGKKRYVPIHPKIKHLIQKFYDEAIRINSKRLFNGLDENGKYTHISYEMYYDKYMETMKELKLNLEHLPHDPRKHFVTMAKDCELNEYAIKYIVGHQIKDVTEKVYTERNTSWLQSEMQKIK